jgi:hypothetical protein
MVLVAEDSPDDEALMVREQLRRQAGGLEAVR